MNSVTCIQCTMYASSMQCLNMLAIVYCSNKSSQMLLRDFWVCNAVKGGTHEWLTTFFSITKQMFAAFYFYRSRSRVHKQSLKSDKSRPKTDRALTIHSKEVYNIFIICFRRDSSTILKIIYQNLALCNSNTIFWLF